VLLQAASLTPVKNQMLLLEVLRLARQELPDLRLLVAGDGPERMALAAAAAKLGLAAAADWLPATPFAQMPAFYPRGHLYVQSSRHESQGLAVLEALACGLPAIGTPVGVLPEVACSPASRDPGLLAGQAAGILADPAAYQAARETARATVEERFALERTVEGFFQLYGSLVRA
jgi:glycosyltransferase involved in cell wall biosynthesis